MKEKIMKSIILWSILLIIPTIPGLTIVIYQSRQIAQLEKQNEELNELYEERLARIKRLEQLAAEVLPDHTTRDNFGQMLRAYFEHGNIGSISYRGDDITIGLSTHENGLRRDKLKERLEAGGFYEIAKRLEWNLNVETLEDAIKLNQGQIDYYKKNITTLIEREHNG